MKKVKYVLIGVFALCILGAILNQKKKETDSNKVS
jgi:hypothetical protein